MAESVESIRGSIEILGDDGTNLGIAGVAWTPESAAIMAYAVAGVTDLVAAEPEPNQHGRTPVAAWTGSDPVGDPVSVFLWREEPFEETAVAQAIAVAIQQARDGNGNS